MQVKNNYDVLWEETDGSGVGMGIFNGDIGRIEQIDKDSNLVLVDFEGRRAVYSPDMMTQLEPAYAVTVHKSQGSEFTRLAVIFPEENALREFLSRQLLYTAVTRFREAGNDAKFILLYDRETLLGAVSRDNPNRELLFENRDSEIFPAPNVPAES